MDVSKFRRTVSFVASAALITALTVGAFAAPATAKPDEQKAEARAAAKAARNEAKQARAEARAAAKAARNDAKQARAEARAAAKAARKAAKAGASEKVSVCHKPDTPAERTLEISPSALAAHVGHGDVEGACGATAPTTLTTCQEPGTPDAETGQAGVVDGEGAACDEPQQVVVSIDAPTSIGSQDPLQLDGAVSGIEADDLSYTWSSTCLSDTELVDPAIVTSEPDTAVLVIGEGTLPPGATCEFTLSVIDEATGADGSATVAVEVLALP